MPGVGPPVIARTFLWLTRRAPVLRRFLWRRLFEFLAGRFQADWWSFMNYGYHDAASPAPTLRPADQDNRYPINLYLRVVDGLDVAGKDLLEIGCGRGGGAAAVSRYLRPRRMTGIDISHNAIAICRRIHDEPGLEFLQGDAEALPFPAESFDAVVNVESSFCYPSMEQFLAEVRRVLRPGGHFLYADIRLAAEMPELEAALAHCGLECLREADITDNVATALRLDSARRSAASRRVLPWPAQQWFDVFLGIEGTRIPNGLIARDMVYRCYKFRKSAAVRPIELPIADAPIATTEPVSLVFRERSLRRHAGE